MKRPLGLVTASLAAAIVLTVSFLIATGTRGEDTSFASSAGQLEVQTVASGLVNPWSLAFLPDGRMLVTERPGRMRIVTPEGTALAAAQGRAGGLGVRPGRIARCHARQILCAEPHHLFLLCRTRRRRRAHRGCARAKLNDGGGRLDDVNIIFRQQGPLSSGNHYRLPHCAGERRQPVRDARRAFHVSRRGAESRQPSRQADPHHARRLCAEGQSVRRARRRKA